MPAASSSMISLDEYDVQSFFFPAADDLYGSQVETLEAVLLRQPVNAASPAAAAVVEERERERELEPAAGESGRACSSVLVAAAPRRRPFRTDRHSKIRTAQGVRDRRMRLSVGVARDFFALQDKLGFDKASKTVDWLLTQSKPAIDRLSLSLADAAAPGDSDTAVPPPEPSAASAASAPKEKGEATSSSTTSAGTKDDAREKSKAKASAQEKQVIQARSRGVGSSASPGALTDEHDWSVSAPAETTTIEHWPMDGLEYHYYHYHNHLEEMI
ncbi:hypothetical protein GUJ93_ZPchr0010g7275 [Zizania palustris]|uniref:TCP domain-containing protein n=1 Tax=Zizania palustris TaxID=103762 RepID=A0A8J5WD20_ZIZPA|nr:hypothetical protein GUJ93_ZPchr0010g7275 [Zizania palustris]